MPTQDLNMAKMLDDFENVVPVTETTTGFLAENGETISAFFTFTILFVLFLFSILIIFFIFNHFRKTNP